MLTAETSAINCVTGRCSDGSLCFTNITSTDTAAFNPDPIQNMGVLLATPRSNATLTFGFKEISDNAVKKEFNSRKMQYSIHVKMLLKGLSHEDSPCPYT